MVIILALVHLVVLLAAAFQLYRREGVLRKIFWPAFLLKVLCGVCVGLIYSYYYSVSDTFVYFDDASRLALLARSDFASYLATLWSPDSVGVPLQSTEPRSLFFVKITSIFTLLTGGSYWVVASYFSGISFLASWFLVKTISRNLPQLSTAAAFAFLFFPTAVFWSSGVLKESLAIAALLYLSGVFLTVWFKNKITGWHALSVVMALWVLWNVKYFYAGVFVAALAATVLCRVLMRRERGSFEEAFVWMMVISCLLVPVSFLHPNFHFDRLLQVVVSNHAAYVKLSDPGNVVEFNNLRATVWSILVNAPWALFSGLFRPFFWEASSILQLLAGVENTLLLIFSAGALLKAGAYRKSPHRLLILCGIVYVISLCVFLTLSAPNFGTMSRYRTGYIMFFVFLVLCRNPFSEYVERSFNGLLINKGESTFKP